MTPAQITAIVATLTACALLYWSYTEISILRGGIFWELRYLLLGCAGFLALSCAERIGQWLIRTFNIQADD